MESAVLKPISSMAAGGQAVLANTPCAGCKFLRRKCQQDCIFKPYFPPDQPQKFVNVHRVFGASNVSKILNELSPFEREAAVNSLFFEAEMRLRDPIKGCVGIISLLQRKLRQLQIDLFTAQSELVKCQSQLQQKQQQHQKMMMMRGYAAEMVGSFGRPSLAVGDDHQHNTLGAIS
ncbi:protein ASYMMETRIC LEAVES 2-like [Dendrobium catenatum]|uniref:LOB domain-containing protein 6 n=1 Tax=Dendrobium catenatum TaxID=906689 RepID=A0A2I0W3B5_9ASPA|nr:protein ASYMMETRIC LEAVES 2-like [Dendrobium catenatum]XP_020676862.1 protein ASYMMETRIC LEAVES 2-like [Dendrobium catenatum]PKU70147.1 LOB domain-containing protein 6 [Dendrobium catenatum]